MKYEETKEVKEICVVEKQNLYWIVPDEHIWLRTIELDAIVEDSYGVLEILQEFNVAENKWNDIETTFEPDEIGLYNY